MPILPRQFVQPIVLLTHEAQASGAENSSGLSCLLLPAEPATQQSRQPSAVSELGVVRRLHPPAMNTRDPYSVLGIPRDAPAEQVDALFLFLSNANDPKMFRDLAMKQKAASTLKQLSEAYSTIRASRSLPHTTHPLHAPRHTPVKQEASPPSAPSAATTKSLPDVVLRRECYYVRGQKRWRTVKEDRNATRCRQASSFVFGVGFILICLLYSFVAHPSVFGFIVLVPLCVFWGSIWYVAYRDSK